MKVVKKTEMFTIYVKSSGRFAVKDANKNWINAEEKVKILVENGFIKAFVPPVKKESDVEQEINEAPAEEAPAAEAPAEEAPAEDAPEEETKLKSASKAKAKESPKAKPKTKAKTES
ncbi:MAG: hypothetical protein MKZ90_03080 [Pseudomonadales bacterium]|nr:hypothetical protein [Pseudomonadales bacterium]